MIGYCGLIRKVLIVGDDTYPWYAPAWVRALVQLGIQTQHLSYSSLWSPGLLGRIERRYLLGTALSRINLATRMAAQEFGPDVVLLYAAFPVRRNTVEWLTEQHWVATYHNDDPFGVHGSKSFWRQFHRSLSLAHSHHVYRACNVEDYARLGIKRVAELRSYYLPWCDRPPSFSIDERVRLSQDVVFVGHAEADDRVGYTRALVDAGLSLSVYGSSQWEKLPLPQDASCLRIEKPIYGEAYRKILAASKICLSFFSRANRDQYTRRVFEIPAVGGFLMAERTPVMESLYTEDKEAVYFSSADELVDKCRFYLNNERSRRRIADAGYIRCTTSGYDVFSRMSQWLADTEQWITAAGSYLPHRK